MKEYHKIQTVYKRDVNNNFKTLVDGAFALPEFAFLKNNKWDFMEKIDGTNIRVMFRKENLISFAGKTDRAQIPTFLLNRLNERFLPLIADFRNIFNNAEVCLYGEGYGAKIQKGGGNYRSDQDFVLFDIKIGDWWLQREDIENIAKQLDLDIAPIIGSGNLFEMVKKVKEGFYSKWGKFMAEGIVAHPSVELKTRSGRRIITKIKYKDFER